jgi:hypothetical protein
VAELDSCLQCLVIIAAVMVTLIALGKALQNLQCLLLTGLEDIHRLEAPA